MLCKYHWIVLYTVHFTAFCLGGSFFPGHGVLQINTRHLLDCKYYINLTIINNYINLLVIKQTILMKSQNRMLLHIHNMQNANVNLLITPVFIISVRLMLCPEFQGPLCQLCSRTSGAEISETAILPNTVSRINKILKNACYCAGK